MRRQLINRLTMFVTSDRPRYLGDGPRPLPVHLLRVFFSASHLLFVNLISLPFPKWHFVPFLCEFSLLTASFQSPITLPSELIRTEARADVSRVPWAGREIGELSDFKCGCQALCVFFSLQSSLQRCFEFDTFRACFLPSKLNYTNYQCEETELPLMMRQRGVRVCVLLKCNWFLSHIWSDAVILLRSRPAFARSSAFVF